MSSSRRVAPIPHQIIYGTAWKKEDTERLVVQALNAGFRAIDTACQLKHYREDLVGEALESVKDAIPRETVFLQTKFTSIDGQDRKQPLPYNPKDTITAQVNSSFTTSLNNLRTTFLDSYILHSPLQTLSQTLEAWQVLVQLQDEGKIKAIGVSNTYDVGVLHALAKVRMVQVVQNRWYEGNDWDKEVVQYCVENGILYQSFWTLSGSPQLLAHPSLKNLANSAGISQAQALYKFAQLHGVTPLSGTTSTKHMSQDLAVADIDVEAKDEDIAILKSLVIGD
ncbi:NADP-dependent oxidoreductase domain-containing protein [Pterulicium gracile]|uniref:NADP-dependent oxidoreductase domain-containing protein n=1 Tax=Pterulicium gracile TaxID=1884261 RepID=A0A5C3QW28_9AGAR|nr:NADP-dependent oxidoreductase domain-containing protein [Pterula gracilis]